MKIILTGATGMVGEGTLHTILQRNDVEEVLSVSRKPSGISHPKLREILVDNFYDLTPIQNQFSGFDAVLFCLGISSVGLPKDEYYKITYTLTLHFAEIFHHQNPQGKFCYISGAGTDSNEKGSGWSAVKGKTENDLIKIFGKNAYCFRPGFIKPLDGDMKRVNKYYKYVNWMYPLGRKFYAKGFTTNEELATAMTNVAKNGYQKPILEGDDIIKAAGTS